MPLDPNGILTGTGGQDTLSGGADADTIIGLGGDDSLTGAGGDDSLVGGAGDDTLRGGYGDDTLEGGDGDDEIEGLYGNDVIDTGAGDDHVFGRDGDDLIYGREGDDHLIGSIGTDTIYGGAGDDVMAGSQGNDELHGGDGNDFAFIGVYEDSDRIFMDAGNDIVDGASAGSSFYAEGGTGHDVLTSGVGDDTLLGGTGDDILHGGTGDDILSGGGDNDTVTGGDGDDVFVLQDVPGTLLITDFGANGAADMIDLSQLDGYATAQDVSAVMTSDGTVTTLDFAVTGGTLTVTVQSQDPLVAEDLGLEGELVGNDGEDDPDDGGDDDGGDNDDTVGGGSDDATTYSLAGPDAGHFVVDADTGEVSNMDWFTPSFDQVWDTNGDHIYEVSVLGVDADGTETSRSDLELVVTETGASWRDAADGEDAGDGDDDTDDDDDDTDDTGDDDTGDDGDDDSNDDDGDDDSDNDDDDDDDDAGDDETDDDDSQTAGVSYVGTGDDAALFDVDAETGEVSIPSWFTPSYDEVWDLDRDHIYELSVVGSDEDGAEVSRTDLELVVSETDAVWREATPEDTGDDTTDDDNADDDNTDESGTGDDTEDTPDSSIYAGADADGVIYGIEGPDADIFEVDADTGDVSYVQWFQPSYDQVWDMDRDHIYELSLVGTDEDGTEVSRTDLELVVSENDDATWREAPGSGEDAEMSGEALMALLFTPVVDEDQPPMDADTGDTDIDII